MKTGEYWQDRAGQIASRLHSDADAYNKALRREYDIALQTIQRDIDVFYQRYAEDNMVSMSDARKLLSGSELKEFRMTLEEFIAKAKDNADGRWTRQLNNAYYRTRISRYEALQTQVRHQVEMLTASRQEGTGKLLGDTYKEAYYRNLFEIQKGTGVGFSFAKIDNKRLQKVLGTEFAESNWSKRIWGDRNKLSRELETKIAQSLIRGDSLDRMAQDVAERMQVSYSSAHRLVQTETAYFAEQATMDSYKEAGVQQFEFLATLDERTCPICGPLDGKVFKVSEQNPGINCGPLHPRCRCTTVPYFDDDINFGERIAKDREGSVISVPGDTTYSKWRMEFAGGSKTGLKTSGPDATMEIKNSGRYKKLEDCYKSVSINNIEPAYSDSIKERLLDLQNTYPVEEGEILLTTSKDGRSFGYSRAQIVQVQSKGQSYAEFQQKLNFSSKLMGTKDASVSLHTKTYKARGSKLINDKLGFTTIDHEYAHAIDNAYVFARRPDLRRFAEKYSTKQPLTWMNIEEINEFNRQVATCEERMSEEVWKKLKKEYGLSNIEFTKLVKEELGSYAASSKAEFLAEGFTNFRSLSSKDSTRFIKDFERVFNEEFKKVLGD